MPRSGDQRAGSHEQARTVAVGERAEASRQHEHHDRHGDRREPALEGAVAGDLLQVDREVEEQDRDARVHGECFEVADREVAPREQVELQHRLGDAPLVGQEQAKGHDARHERDCDHRAAPAVVRLLDQREHDAGEPERTEARHR